jgi:hypothetical protein
VEFDEQELNPMRNAIVNAAGFPVGGADETPTIPCPALVEPK